MIRRNKAKVTGYSLIEMSVILLILGAILTGVYRGFEMAREFKLEAARNLTQSSSIQSIDGLVLWMEPTMLDSFAQTDLEDGDQITQWNGRGLNEGKQYYALTDATPHITYIENGINGLPSLYFNGGSNSAKMTLSDSTSIADAKAIQTQDNAFTFFVVAKLNNNESGSRAVFQNGHGSGEWGYGYNGSESNRIRRLTFGGAGTVDVTSSNATSNPEIISATYDGSSKGNIKLYTNGEQETLSSDTVITNAPTNAFDIGNQNNGHPFDGYISEVIIFDRKISSRDYAIVESYLKKKYNLPQS